MAEESTPIVAPPVKSAETTPPPVRRSAVRDIVHKAPPETSRAVKETIANKIGDRLEKASEAAGLTPSDSTDGKSRKVRHHVEARFGREEKPIDTPTGEKPADSKPLEDAATESTPSEEKPPETPVATTPEISPEVRRSLHNFGYDDAAIDSKLKTGGDSFVDIAKVAHEMRKKEVEAWARLGRNAPTTQSAPITPNVLDSDDASLLKEVEATEAAHPNDAFVKVWARDAKAGIAYRANQRYQTNQAQLTALQQQVDTFFAGDGLKPYAEHYKNPEAKNKVVDMAAAILIGARAQGKNLNLTDALTAAHDSVAAPVVRAAMRQKIESEVQKRNDAITQRGVGATPPPTTRKKGQPLTRREIEDRAGERLKKVKIR